MLPFENRKRAQARMKSCSGIGAQWVAALPADPKTMFSDEDFRINTRFRLGLDWPWEGKNFGCSEQHGPFFKLAFLERKASCVM